MGGEGLRAFVTGQWLRYLLVSFMEYETIPKNLVADLRYYPDSVGDQYRIQDGFPLSTYVNGRAGDQP